MSTSLKWDSSFVRTRMWKIIGDFIIETFTVRTFRFSLVMVIAVIIHSWGFDHWSQWIRFTIMKCSITIIFNMSGSEIFWNRSSITFTQTTKTLPWTLRHRLVTCRHHSCFANVVARILQGTQTTKTLPCILRHRLIICRHHSCLANVVARMLQGYFFQSQVSQTFVWLWLSHPGIRRP